MKKGVVIDLTIACFEGFNPLRVSADTQLDEFLKERKIVDENASLFIREVFLGMLRYAKLLNMTVDGLFERHKASVVRTDRTRYTILTLLAVYKMEELGFSSFRKLVLSQPSHKMLVWLGYMFDEQILNQWFPEQWSTIYDIHFVNNCLIAGMKRFESDAKGLLTELERLVQPISNIKGTGDGSDFDGDQVKNFTTPEPFLLSINPVKRKQAPLAVPREDPILPFKPLPAPTHLTLITLADVEKKKEDRRQKIKQEAIERYRKDAGFELSSGSPAKQEELRKQIEMERAIIPAPRYKSMNFKAQPEVPIKMTVASILREDALYRREQEEKMAELKRFAEEMKDTAEFETWKSKVEAEEEKQRSEYVQKRKEELQQLAEKVNKSMLDKVEENHDLMLLQKEEMRQLMLKRQKQIAMEQIHMKQLKEEVMQMKLRAEKEREETFLGKKQMAAVCRQEKHARELELEKKKQEDMASAKELIKQIQAMEKMANERAKRPKEVDPTVSSGVRLLEEMSLAELRERLQMTKERTKEEEARKRKEILSDKFRKTEHLEGIMHNHERLRQYKKSEATKERDDRRRKEAADKEKVEKVLLEKAVILEEKLATKYEDKRHAAVELAKELKIRRQQLNFYMATKQQQMANRLRDLALSRERKAEQEELSKQNEASLANAVLEEEEAMRKGVRLHELKVKKKFLKNYEATLEELKRDSSAFDDMEFVQRRINVQNIHDRRGMLSETLRFRNPYAAQMSKQSQIKARQLAQRKEFLCGERAKERQKTHEQDLDKDLFDEQDDIRSHGHHSSQRSDAAEVAALSQY